MSVIRLSLSRNMAFHTAKEKTTKESWSGTVTDVSASAGKEKLKFDEVRDLIVSEEIRRRESGKTSGSALSTENRGRSESGNSNRGRSRSRNKYKSGKDKSSIECWNCKKHGHYRNQCKAPIKERKDDNSANVATEEISDALISSVSSPLESWVLDSGASFHSCPNANIMENYTFGNFGKVYLVDDEPLEIAGKGDWKALVENETGLKVKCLRSDNGGDYELDEFKEYCAVNGIHMEKTVRGTPQQNGVAERMNRTLNERAR
ncbi:hypothetical protein CRG98_022510 [Punica granatum]|uniref:CCHC-type domain-containing protein n=1 Tax=Punica granatum TaxID=22663 RepID=A0A2I0JNM5_PUNGR|nr:hypothetical protein CRG98_022510 [Punica granatum]